MLWKLPYVFSLKNQKLQIVVWSLCLVVIINQMELGEARCRSERLLPGVKIIGTCEGRETEVCNVQCEYRGTAVWKTQVQCLNSGWSPTPHCQGASVVKSLQLVNCENLPGNVQGKSFCLKITQKITRDKTCPDLINLRLDARKCSRKPNTDCRVFCGTDQSTLKCLPNGKWSHIPKCGTQKLKLCPAPKVGKLLKCSRREGRKCKFQCPDGEVMDGEVICLPSGVWSQVAPDSLRKRRMTRQTKESDLNIFSKCSCPTPPVKGELITAEDCSQKKIGEKCHLGCKKHFAILGNSFTICQKDLSWSKFPECSDKTCPIPQIVEPLEFAENCASKLSGEKCELRCGGVAKLMQKNPLKCINGTHWSQFPHCVCFPPVLPDDMLTDEDCDRKGVGRTCKLKCKGNFSILGLNFLTCQNNGSWTLAPSCQRNVCTKPDLPRVTVTTTEDCTSKRIGESCNLECLKVPETYQIQCLNNTQWSTYPYCSCPSPSFSKNIQLEEDCSEKKPGQKCKVSCKDMPNLKEPMYVSCRSNSEWGTEPPCDKIACPEPAVPSYLLFDEDCSQKGNTDICKLKCKTEGKFVGEGFIRCINGTHWSRFPTCTCPKPYVRHDLEVLEDCSYKKPNETCKVKCRENSSVSNNQSFICQPDTTWADQPTCLKKQCTSPKYPPYLSVTQECKGKTVGGTCEVFCKEGGNIIGLNIITCLDTLAWSSFPSCTCSEPRLNHGLQLSQSCVNKHPGTECEVKCKGHLKLLGNPFIKCLENSSWSEFPMCSSGSCLKPRIPGNVMFTKTCNNKEPGDSCTVKCKDGGRLLGNDIIICLNETHWSEVPLCTCPKPTLGHNLKSISDCDAILPGKECYLQCENNSEISGQNFITCGNDSKWSEQPKCGKFSCQRPELKPHLMIDETCSMKTPGDECKVRCREGGRIIGNPVIKCLNTTTWSETPDCGCQPPLLDEDLESTDKCDDKKIGEKCNLSCKEGKKLIGKSYITCQNNTRWSSQPTCRIQFCSKPFFHGGVLEPTEDCSSKLLGEECELRCTEGGDVIGSNTIKCLNESHWSTFPECSCSTPDLPDAISLVGECTNKTRGMQCKVACKGSRKLIGNDTITCNEKTKWSSFPICETLFCPKPALPKGVLTTVRECSFKGANDKCELKCQQGGQLIGESIITCLNGTEWSEYPDCTCESPELKSDLIISEEEESCASKKRGETCKLSCKNDMQLAGRPYITCQNNTKWSSLPSCKGKFCPTPNISSYLKTKGDCSSKASGQICELSCSGGRRLIGKQSSIKCDKNLRWSKNPRCTCPPLDPRGDLKGNCSSVEPGKSCRVSCRSAYWTSNRNSILCNNDSKWSDLFMCNRSQCPDLEFSESSAYEGKCENKVSGDACYLRCKGSGVFKNNVNFIRCNKEGKWPKPKLCVCPPVMSLVGFILKDKCIDKVPGDKCRIECTNGLDLKDDGFISCDTSYKWSQAPSCQSDFCPTPVLPRGSKITAGNCTHLKKGDSCNLACVNKGVLTGPEVLECDSERKLSKIPTCTCQIPILPRTMRTLDKCVNREVGDTCMVLCKVQATVSHLIECLMSEQSMWSPIPECPCGIPTHLSTYAVLQGSCLKQNIFPVNTTCDLSCENYGNLVGGDNITCLSIGVWSPSPRCACIPPSFKHYPGMSKKLNVSQCTMILPGANCKVSCTDGVIDKLYMHCNTSYFWDAYPTCGATNCPDPRITLFHYYVGLNPECAKQTVFEKGFVCGLVCLNGGLYISPKNIHCQEDATWSATAQCTCPPPDIKNFKPAGTEIDACRNKFKGEKCTLSCTQRGYTIKPNFSTLECLGKEWTGTLECEQAGNWCPIPTAELRDKGLKIRDPRSGCAIESLIPPNIDCGIECSSRNSEIKLLGVRRTHTGFARTSFIKCTSSGTWEPIPQCTCPDIQLPPELVRKASCTRKIHGEKCPLLVRAGYKFNNPFHTEAVCYKTVWRNVPSFEPDIRREPCLRPIIFDPLLLWPPECDRNKFVGDRCTLTCKNSAKFILESKPRIFVITCIQRSSGGTAWSDIPDCACETLEGDFNRKLIDDCDQRRISEPCMIRCNYERNTVIVLCKKDGQWPPIDCKEVKTLSEAKFFGVARKRKRKSIYHAFHKLRSKYN